VSRARALQSILDGLGDALTDEQCQALESTIEDLHVHVSPLHAWHCMSHEVGAVIATYDDLLELLTEEQRTKFLGGGMDLTEIVGLLANAVADAPGTDDLPREERDRIAADPHGSN
jgi:hypothetical protein